MQGDVDRIVEAAIYLYTESRRVTKSLARRHGLTGPQITALKVLEGFGNLSLSELGQRMSAKRSTITGIVDRMERDGLVRRRRSTTDRRVVHLEATARGAQIASAVPVTAMLMFGEALRALPDTDRAELIRILGRIADHVRKTAADQDHE